jgi:hypothetical protein
MRLRFASLIVCLGFAVGTSGCGSSKPAWVADEAVLSELAKLNPEPEPSYEEAKKRTQVAFDSLHTYFAANVPATDGFNICFPANYQAPKDSDPTRRFQFMQQCRLIQNNGPSMGELRRDPLVSKHLDNKGNLTAPADLEAFHRDLNDAWFKRDPTNEQLDLYSGLPPIQEGWPMGGPLG